MKVSANWLKEFTAIDISVDELVKKIGAQLGAVEEVIDLAPKYKGIIVAKVVTCEKHPNADKLSVCLIDDGGKAKGVKRDKDGLIQVVCGAPNVKAGLLVAWLPPGSMVPSSYDKEPFILEAREIRGQVSNGMLASAHELGISDDHSGIVELEGVKAGDDFAKALKLDDYIIDIENKMFTHRPDCFGILGVAREVAGIQHKPFKSPEWYKDFNSNKLRPGNGQLKLEVKNGLKKLVPRFTAIAISGVEVKPSPLWLQSYLSRVGLKPINNIVDLTNYYMVLTGQPLHAYDYDKLPSKSLETRLSRKGEKLTLLGGKEIKFDSDSIILITSGDKPVGVGGVMGGKDTEVDENTKNIVLECANFDMYSIRRASMHLGLFTDAVTRFSKGQSPHQNDRVIARIAEDIQKTAGGKVASRLIDARNRLQNPLAVHVRADFINARLGLDATAGEMAKVLKNVEFAVRVNGPTLVVTPPFWRTDIEIPEDVVEEIGRLIGYDNLPMELPRRTTLPPERNRLVDLKSQIRDVLSKAGANEVLTYSFVHGILLAKVGQDVKKAFKLTNAISPDLHYYRLSLTPSLLERVHPNIKTGYGQFALFEIGKTHNKDHMDGDLPKETEKTAFVTAAKKAGKAGAAYYHALIYLDELMARLGVGYKLETIKQDADYQTAKPFEAGRSAHVIDIKSGVQLGIIGEYKPMTRQSLKLPEMVAGFELSTLKLLDAKEPKSYTPLSRFPGVEQDMTLGVSAELAFGQLDEAVAEATKKVVGNDEMVINRQPIDIYKSGTSKDKHVTYRFRVISYVRTLTATEINELLDRVASEVGSQFKAQRI